MPVPSKQYEQQQLKKNLRVKYKMISNREAIQQQNVSLKVKNRFINLLFVNRQIETATYCKAITCFIIMLIAFLSLSIFFFIQMYQIVQVKVKYYDKNTHQCRIGDQCKVNFVVDETMKQPIKIYYELDNFFRLHKLSILSRSYLQLGGNLIEGDEINKCWPYITNAQMGKSFSWGNSPLLPNSIANPCGSIAYTFFNDTFQLYSINGMIAISESDLSWAGDKGQRFKRGPNSSSDQWIDPENEHFIVWMRTSGLPNFKKPWGWIHEDLPVGTYTMKINNQYNSTDWNSDRYFYLSTTSFLGGKNYFIPSIFVLLALLNLVAIIFFCRRDRALKQLQRFNNRFE